MIELKEVSFRYGANPEEKNENSLCSISLTIHDGETVVLTGPSGCGKTTITRLINGLIPNYYEGKLSGEVLLDGEKINEMSLYDISRKIGSVFQNPKSQFFNVDTDSELAFSLENQGIPADIIRKKVAGTVREFRIEGLCHRNIFDLSGGEKQKIACASVSAEDPEILVLDEPSSNLDISATKDLADCISRWKTQGKTVIIAEHRLRYLRDVADRVICIREGKVIGEYTMRELSERSAAAVDAMGLRPVTRSQFSVIPRQTGRTGRQERLENFIFSYQKEPILQIESTVIPRDEIIAVIGHNGSGKTTFGRCLCGFEKKCRGTVETDGLIQKRKARLKNTFMVMQDVNHELFTESVKEEILISMEQEDEKKADEILASLDLQELSDRHPMSLSGGQKQRVAIAAAIASDRNTLIFDEPTSGLDLIHMKETAESIRWVCGQGRSVLVITHDLELILRCATYVVRIDKGKITEQYPLDEDGITRIMNSFENIYDGKGGYSTQI